MVQNTTKILEKVVARPHKPVDNIYVSFCSLLIRFNSNNPTCIFNHTFHDIGGIFWHMFFRQPSEYKPCKRILNCSTGSGMLFIVRYDTICMSLWENQSLMNIFQKILQLCIHRRGSRSILVPATLQNMLKVGPYSL